MRKVYEYSHLGGSQILKTDYPQIDKEIDEVIQEITGVHKTKSSKEKTMKGRRLYSPIDLNARFERGFHKRGYQELKDVYTIKLPKYKKEIQGAYKQVDFVKGKVLIEVQFGKYPFMFYDLAKFQYFFKSFHAQTDVDRRVIWGTSYLRCRTIKTTFSCRTG